MSLGTGVALLVLAAAVLFIETVKAIALTKQGRIRRRKGN